MSDFLHLIPGEQVTLGTDIPGTQAIIKAKLIAQGWQVLSEDTTTSPTTQTTMVTCPPSSETLGTAWMRDVLVWTFTSSMIKWQPIPWAVQDFPQAIRIHTATAGAATVSAAVNGTTISHAGSTGDTSLQNLLGLLSALQASSDSNITDWTWFHFNSTIWGLRKTSGTDITPTGTNCTAASFHGKFSAGLQSSAYFAYTQPPSITIDLTNGFVYFLQICKRGLALATRTAGGYYGPIHAEWLNHAKALSVMPTATPGFERYISPIELVVGYNDAATNGKSYGYLTHLWGESNNQAAGVSASYNAHPITRSFIGYIFQDWQADLQAVAATLALSANGIFSIGGTYQSFDNLFSIYQTKLGSPIYKELSIANGSGGDVGVLCCGVLDLEDWWRYVGTASDESLRLFSALASSTTLNQTMAYGTDYSTLAVTDASALAASGHVFINGNCVAYTGKSGNTLTGCTCGTYATTKMPAAIGEAIYQGLWGIKINGGLLFGGTTKPVAS